MEINIEENKSQSRNSQFKNFKLIILYLLIILIVNIFLLPNLSFSKDNENANTSIIKISSQENAHYCAMNIQGNTLLAIYEKNNKFIFEFFNLKKMKFQRKQEIDSTYLNISNINECTLEKNGNIVVKNNDSKIIFNSNFKILKKSKENKIEKQSEKSKKNPLISNKFDTYNNFAYFKSSKYKINNIEFSCINATAFYNTPEYIYIEYINNGILSPITSSGKKILATTTNSTEKQIELGVFNYSSKKVNKITISTLNFASINGCGTLNNTYAAFSINEQLNNNNIDSLYIWKYNESSDNQFNVKQVNESTLVTVNNILINKIKEQYNVNVYIDKCEDNPYYKLSVTGTNPFINYIILTDINRFFEYFPKNFVNELNNANQNNKKDFNIYIIKKIEDTRIAAYAIPWGAPSITLQNDCYYSENLPHEFMHVIDQRIYEYYQNQDLSYDAEWRKTNSDTNTDSSKLYYASNSGTVYNVNKFITNYSQTNEREDRAETFKDLFIGGLNGQTRITSNTHKKKAKLLCDSIRSAYQSTSNTENLVWEKNLVSSPTQVNIQSSTNNITLSWKTVINIPEIEIQRYINNEWKTISITKGNNYTAKKLNAGTHYNFRIRSYIIQNGIKNYGPWTYIKTSTTPKKTSLKNVKLLSNGNTAKIKWNKVKSKASGYQIQYSTDKQFKTNTQKVNVKNINTTNIKLKKLDNNTKYYIRIRAYRSVSGQKYYSSWSKTKSLKTI